MEYVAQGKMKVGRFEDKTGEELKGWYNTIADYLNEKNMIENPTCSYAMFIREKLPQAWKLYENKFVI